MKRVYAGLAVVAATILFGCGGGLGNSVVVETITLPEDGDPPFSNEDVFFIFTNPDPDSRALGVPDVHFPAAAVRGRSAETDLEGIPVPNLPPPREFIDPQLWRLPEDVRPVPGVGGRNAAAPSSAAYSLPMETPDVTWEDFHIYYGSTDTIRATCRASDTIDGKTLSIYVADDSWYDGGSGTYLMNEEMVQAVFDKFLSEGDDNDIWEWVVEIFGEPWGIQYYQSAPFQYVNLLEEGAEDHITILFCDIEEDDSPDGGIGGYYSSTNNYVDYVKPNGDEVDYPSNERLMFVMDSVMFANPVDTWDPVAGEWTDDSGDWNTGDLEPKFIISALVHEFQHMIHYYQKTIANDNYFFSDTWLNEMCSMVAEDLIAEKIGVPGPRGVDPPTDMTAGTSEDIVSSRVFAYNGWHDRSLTNWSYYDEEVVGYDYAASYSFGAFLARNYGGAALFRRIVRSSYNDQRAVTESIQALALGSPTFEDLLVEWAQAVIMSDTEEDPDEVKTYNSGGAFVSSPESPSGSGVNLGSINLYNYRAYATTGWTSIDGPLYYVNGGDTPERPGPASNVIFLAAENTSDPLEIEVEIPEGMTLTVVRRPHIE